MTRTIIIEFINSYTGKQYAFLSNDDSLRIGDIIKDPNYENEMCIVDILSRDLPVYNGYILKWLKTTEIMEKRNISITIEEAREWYHGDNDTLKTLALNAFSKDELELNYEYIARSLNSRVCGNVQYKVHDTEYSKYAALTKLSLVAKYFNGKWKKTPYNTGYFIGQSAQGFSTGTSIKCKNLPTNIGICKHETVYYPGIVYFKDESDALKAVQILQNELKDLF